ncbi:unnamed protein product [Amoebophrya sp. A25]|nr:unnamed protein product [Amoebophrya sp. A25]|eukprot:GSA25T00020183001.1
MRHRHQSQSYLQATIEITPVMQIHAVSREWTCAPSFLRSYIITFCAPFVDVVFQDGWHIAIA